MNTTAIECAHGCGMITRGGKYLPGHDSRHVANLRAGIRCGDSIEDAFAELRNSPNLYNKLAQALHRDGWSFDPEGRTWYKP